MGDPTQRASRMAIAPGTPSFELHTLGWRAFQNLTGVILRELWGQTFQTFADTNDGGRDGAFYGVWKNSSAEDSAIEIPDGPCVVQCKHSSAKEARLTLSQMTDELSKVRKLVDQGLCRSYVLVTNSRVTGNSEQAIVEALRGEGVINPIILAGTWVNQTIALNDKLRRYVPRIYGLGDLSQILDERAYAQASALLDYMRDDLRTFVVTDSYKRAAKAVHEHGFVLLLGEPAAGKSLIAAMLSMTAVDSDNCAVVKADTPQEVVQRWNPHDPKQLIWADDAFGALRHDRLRTDEWVSIMPKVMTAIKLGTRFVLTSRDYIYREAREFLKEYAFPILAEHQVVVDVDALTAEERRQMLYNHVRLGEQSSETRKILKKHLDKVADAPQFRPELARRIGSPTFTQNVTMTLDGILYFVRHPTEFLRDIYSGLDKDHKAALAIVSASHFVPEPLELSPGEFLLMQDMEATRGGVKSALKNLEGTFLRKAPVPGSTEVIGWQFRHPTLREGFAAYLDENIKRLSVILANLPPGELLSQVDCGSAKRRGNLMEVPPALYHQVAERILEMKHHISGSWRRKRAWHRFFVDHCSTDFISQYMEVDPEFLAGLLEFYSYLDSHDQPAILARLHQAGLLPEAYRRRAIANVWELAVETPDAGWTHLQEWKILLTQDERDTLKEHVRKELIPNLDAIRSDWYVNRDSSDDDPDSYYYLLEDALKHYKEEFSDIPSVSSVLVEAIERVRDDAAEEAHESDYRGYARKSDDDDHAWPDSIPFNGQGFNVSGRSIFDDLDS